MSWLWCLALVSLAAAIADEVSDPKGLLANTTEPASPDDYRVFIGRWTECEPVVQGERAARVQRSTSVSSPLVYTPQLGLQRRQLWCRAHDGKAVVEFMYCGGAVERIGMTRVCVIREPCRLGEWLPWRPRADGALVRTRRVLRLPQGEGKECDVVEEVRPAALEPTAHWSPGPWGPCRVAVDQPTVPLISSDDDNEEPDTIYDDVDDDAADAIDDKEPSDASCGGGVQRREAACVRADGRTLHPLQCAHVPMLTLVQPCEVPCPRDCEVGEWSEWGACQPIDGCPLFPVQQLTTTGYSVRRRRVISAASGSGAPCPPLEEKRTCSAPRCAAWKALPWGPCVLNQPHTTCGLGRRSRELRCVGHDGKEAQRAWCSATGAPARSERCRIACAGDCVVSTWGPWSPCSAACAGSHPRPTKQRRRFIMAHASTAGWPCPPEDQLVQTETCNNHACATYSWLATPWGACERRPDSMHATNYTDLLDDEPFNASDEEEPCIEEGEMTRDVMCVQNNADVVREVLCAPLRRPASRRACTIRCRRGCKVQAWMPWSPCPNTCEPGKQIRVRKVSGGPNCGPLQETRACPVARSCRAPDAAWITGEWSTCRLPPDQRCGRGYRVRSIWCGSAAHRVEAGACAGQLVPRSVAECLVSCDRDVTTLTCDTICSDPLKYLDAAEPDIPTCNCKDVTLELLPADSDCILPPGLECGEGRSLRAAICMLRGRDVPMDVCKKYHKLTGPHRVREASTDGFTYDEEFPALLRGACSVQCARDCAAGEWGEWGPCAIEPGSRAAFRFRTRELIEEGSGGGRECGATLQRATCSVPQPRWRVGEWSVCWPPHPGGCGHSLMNRTVVCEDEDGNVLDDEACEAAGAGAFRGTEAYCTAPCPKDCVVSAWSDFSPCEVTKRGGQRDRTRVVLRPAAEGGAECPFLVEAVGCTPRAHSWHITPWADCQPLGGSPCGEGIKKRSVRCLRSDGMFVNDSFCPNKTASEVSESWCYVPCGVDCTLGEWGAWDTTACRAACGDAPAVRHMRRTRPQLTAAVWPGRACPPKEQRAPCPREPCLRLIARPLLGCQLQTRTGEDAMGACGWGMRVSHTRCEVLGAGDEPSGMHVEPWRCAPALPGRIVTPPLQYQEDEICDTICGCRKKDLGVAGPWSQWGPCRGGARSRARQMLAQPKQACATSARYVTIEWANCSGKADEVSDLLAVEPRDEPPRRAWLDRDQYREGYFDNSMLAGPMVWIATVILSLYGGFMLYRGFIRCIRSRKMKSITKV